MLRSRTSARLATLIAGLVVTAGLVAVSVPGTAFALDSPSSLQADDSPIPVLSWERVPTATGYDVQVSRVADFTSTIVNTSTVNQQYVPLLEMPTGELWWRVRAKASGVTPGDWTTASFSRTAQAAPVMVQPLADATFTPPQTPRFTWEPVPGATSYTVQTSPDDAFTDPALIAENKQKTTAAYLTGYPEVGSYFWRVGAELSTGFSTAWSDPVRYQVRGLPDVQRTSPADTFEAGVHITDVVLDWEPVTGASGYDIRIDTDRNFLTVDHSTNGITGTRYSPPATLNNDDFYWQVRPVNASGKAAPWPETPWRFERAWPDQPEQVYPIGAPSPGAPFFYEWNPIERASKYVVHLYDATGQEKCTFTTMHTTLAGECVPATAGTYRWKVEGIDEGASPAPRTALLNQAAVEFAYQPPPVITPAPGLTAAMVTGQAASVSGVASYGIGIERESCGDDLPDQCDDLRQTPVLTWDAVPGATAYRIVITNDANGANVHSVVDVDEPMWTPTTSFTDSQAGSAYYWVVLPCGTTCAAVTLPTHAFAKESVAPKPIGPVDGAEVSDDVTLDWGSLLDALDDPSSTVDSDVVTPADTDAKQYVVQTSIAENFSSVLESRTVDQTTFTSFANTYPEGPVYWRVAAIDGGGRQTVWSATEDFVKRSPAPVLLSPGSGEALGQDYTLSWNPLNFAVSYEVEVYAGATRVATANPKHASWSPSVPFPAAAEYTWRVRRLDAQGRKGEWSPTWTFRVEGFPPAQAAPAADAVVAPSGGLFSWEPDPRATSYRFERRKPGSTTDMAETVTTRGTAWAPTAAMVAGTAQWRVTALDTAGISLGSSPWRDFVVIDPPAVATPVSISGTGKVGTELRLSAPTFDPVTETPTYQWYRGTSAISGATADFYQVSSSDVSQSITVRATGALAGYKNATSTSNAVVAVTGDAPVASAPPSITGVARFAETLTVTPGTWPGTPTYKYQWFRDGVAIGGASAATYKLVAPDVDHSIHVVETATLGGRTPGTAVSDAVTPEAGDAPVATAPPRISPSSAVKSGDRLTVTRGTWAPSATYTYTYQWYREDVAIAGASATSYTLVGADVGRHVHVVETATAAGRVAGTAASTAIVPNGAVVATSPPTITGVAGVGKTLTAGTGSWPGSSPRFKYQWLRNGTAISGATGATYTPVAADATRRVHVRVTATVTGYSDGTASSVARTIPKMSSATTLSLSATKTSAKQRVTASIRVTVPGLSAPGGTVALYDGRRKLATVRVSSSGTATYRLPKLKPGKHTIKAVYSGGTQVNGSQRTAKLTVTRR